MPPSSHTPPAATSCPPSPPPPVKMYSLEGYNIVQFFFFLKQVKGLPWRLSGGESTCQRRRHRFNPWSGKIPHAAEQLSPCGTTTEPVLQSRGTHNYRACAPEPGGPQLPSLCSRAGGPTTAEPVLQSRGTTTAKPVLQSRGTTTAEPVFQSRGTTTAETVLQSRGTHNG